MSGICIFPEWVAYHNKSVANIGIGVWVDDEVRAGRLGWCTIDCYRLNGSRVKIMRLSSSRNEIVGDGNVLACLFFQSVGAVYDCAQLLGRGGVYYAC